ncbi:hypothetical protein [Heterosigma akashiwo virus 01]|jgi:abhydrolase domain-containing protein 13|uniref:Serine aminopeptidase S33 domain-containing protein n=1 Tax=Heterosigma akashiwo virus 01 TaxID=97195 RepID=A0A1C9C5K3_HAV01|nr:hypothetical protein D1R72_gp238 [Heterosigma akashiwo virus 01]AOM63569.1 hypothetical protein [Heterosigma akashiwo virus 01]
MKNSQTIQKFNRKHTLKPILVLFIISLSLLFTCFIIQKTFVFANSKYYTPYTNGYGHSSPDEYKFDTYDDFMLDTIDGSGNQIHVWSIRHGQSIEHPTILFFHGNRGNVGSSLPMIAMMYFKLNVNVVIFDYRGYGLSSGSPSEDNVYNDTDTVWNYIKNNPALYDINNIFLYGRSLGGAIAFYLAEKMNSVIRGIIVENTIYNAKFMVQYTIPLVGHVIKHLMLSKFNNNIRIVNVTKPILIFTCCQDKVVNCINSYKLYEHVEHRKNTCLVRVSRKDAKHTNLWRSSFSDNYFEIFKRFILYYKK